jgi:hypothetical protein
MSNRLALVPVSFSGWALLSASAAEVVSPGISMFIMRLRSHQSHAAFMCLAKITKTEAIMASRPQAPEDIREDLRAKLSQIAALIRTGTTAEIVCSLRGSMPVGFSGFLAKLGPEPLSRPALYDQVFDLFAWDDPRAIVLSLMEGPLSMSTVNIVLTLDEAALHPEFVGALKNEQAAAALNAGLGLIRKTCSTVISDDIRQALHKAGNSFCAIKFVEKFLLRKMDTPPGPRPLMADDDVFELLDHGPSLLRASRRFRNCLRQKAIQVATGKAAFAVTRDKDIAFEMRPLTHGAWLIVDVLGLKNEPVSSDDWQWFLQRIRERGISMIALPSPETRTVLDHLQVFDVGIFVEPHFPTEIEVGAA